MTTATLSNDRVALSKLVWVAPLAIVASIIANGIVYLIADALFDVEWLPMFTLGGVIGATVVQLIMAAIAFALVSRFAKRPIWLYQRVAAVALVLSFIPTIFARLGMMAPPEAQVSAAPVDTFITMLIMHVVAYAVSTQLFIRLARD